MGETRTGAARMEREGPSLVDRTRSALDEHLAASHEFDLELLAAGYAVDAELVTHEGDTVVGRDDVVAWFGERSDFFGNLDLRAERLEIGPGRAALEWWGALPSGPRLEGRDEFEVNRVGAITRQVVASYARTDREPAYLRIEHRPPVLAIVLTRPDKRNAVSQPMLRRMTAAVGEADDDPDIGAILLRGEGSAFCAGEDVDGFTFPDIAAARSFLDGPFDLFTALETATVPVVAAVHGPALGFGSEVLLVCDAVYAHPDSVLGFAEIDHGAVPSVLVTRGLDVVFPRRALDLALTGRRFDAQEAVDLGLVHVVDDDPVRCAQTAAHEMGTWSATAVATVKRWLGHGARDDHDRARDFMPPVLLQVRSAR